MKSSFTLSSNPLHHAMVERPNQSMARICRSIFGFLYWGTVGDDEYAVIVTVTQGSQIGQIRVRMIRTKLLA